MSRRSFATVDVFTSTPYLGNPVAVVLDAEGLDAEAMRCFARWTNLSETTFVLAPTSPRADYRVRIFTPTLELPFAGHPTLGTAHAWLEHGGADHEADRVVQECGLGLIEVRRTEDGLAFAAPPLQRSGPVEPALLDEVAAAMRIEASEIVDARWAHNGPPWIAVMLRDAAAVLAVEPGPCPHDVGLVGAHPPGAGADFEVRAFFPKDGVTVEDPVTGSLNAGVAQWLLGEGLATAPYVATQGTALGRAGRIHVTQDDAGTIWIGGGTTTCVVGSVEL